MSSFWRFTLFGLFGAAGIGLAMCVAMSSPPAGASLAEPPTVDAVRETSPKRSFPSPAEPVFEQVQPRIAASSPAGSSSNPAVWLAQATGNSNLGQPAPLTQAEVLDQLRQQMQKALQAKQFETAAGQPELPNLPDLAPRRTNENGPGGAAPPRCRQAFCLLRAISRRRPNRNRELLAFLAMAKTIFPFTFRIPICATYSNCSANKAD